MAEAGREPVRCTAAGPVLLVTLDRPEKRNAVDEAVTLALDAAFGRLEADPALRVAVLAAEGEVFCAGSDLVAGAGPHTADGGQYGVVRRARSKPLVAAVGGPALGGGFELVLAADLVVASRDAWFALPETIRGRVPAAGGLFRAPDRLPRNVAVELMLTGGRLDADRAFALGLVNRVVDAPDVLATAIELALATCVSSPEATARLLGSLREVDAAGDRAGWAVTATAMQAMLGSEDRTEGNAAFTARRAPAWVPDDTLRASVVRALVRR